MMRIEAGRGIDGRTIKLVAWDPTIGGPLLNDKTIGRPMVVI